MTCFRCGRELSRDENGASRKILGKYTRVFYCIDCLAEEEHVTRKDLEDMIERYRKAGCTLFT